MSDIFQFEPIFPSHAVERCVATISFSESLPAKAFQKVLDRAQATFRDAGLEAISGVVPSGGASFGIQIDVSTGRATQMTGPGPLIYTTADRATQFIVAQNSLSARTGRYIRWEPFAGQIEEFILSLVGMYGEVVSIQNVQLDYLDRFLWSGDWSNFDWRELIRDDGNFVTGRVAGVRGQWHSHSGWFEHIDGGRRLVNVNIDLAEFPRSEVLSVPSVGIVTLMRDDVLGASPGPNPRYEDGATIQVGLEGLHNDLKTLLAQIITDTMAQRIALNIESSNVANH